MKTKFKQTGMLIFGALLFNACTGQPQIAKVTEQESMKYINEFNKEYNQIQKSFKDNTITKWVQPSNKKEKCTVEVNFGITDRTLDDSYKLLWDGSCKDGKANGLGRIFESSDIYEQSIITIYKKGKISNACFVKREFENTTLMGECRGNELELDFDFSKTHGQGVLNNFNIISTTKLLTINKPTYNVVTKIYDNLQNFNIEQKYGTYGNINTPIMIDVKSPFINNNAKLMLYPNYGYQLGEYNNGMKSYGTLNKNDKNTGYQYRVYSNGNKQAIEINNDNFIRRAILSINYTSMYKNIEQEINNAKSNAEASYKKAQIIKQKYKNRICDDSIKVNFMKKKQYKSICNEDKYYANLQKKINSKLAMIEQKKHNKSLVNAEQAKANAYNRQANAQHRAAAAAESANFNQSMQNINNNMQMNTLNNNLFMMRMGY